MSPSLHRTALPVAAALFIAATFAAPSRAQEKQRAGEKDAATEKATGDTRVNDAIDKGIAFLLAEIEKEQAFKWDDAKRSVGQVALETYALIVAGVDVEHPLIKKNFDYLSSRALQTGYTYTLACYAFALDAAIAQKESDVALSNPDVAAGKFRDNPNIGREYREPLTTTIHRLTALQKSQGGWHYDANGNDWDNSNTQFAVLALGVGAKRNIPIDPVVWEKIVDHFIREQDQKKGAEVAERLTMMSEDETAERRHRGRKPKEKVEVEVVPDPKAAKDKSEKGEKKGKEKAEPRTVATPSKTKVGPKALVPEVGTEHIPVYSREWKYGKDRVTIPWNMTCAGLSSLLLARESLKGRLAPDKLEALNASIRDGFGWIMTHWTASPDLYGMYSIEKVADLGGVKKFGSHDWYEEISNSILGRQGGNGGWPGGDGHGNVRTNTSFALLVLNRASQLILMTFMSQNPMSRIMVSGRRSNLQDASDRSWVYVPELDTTIHYPTLLRSIRLRAHPKLVGFLDSIVKYYPDEWKGELIPDMAKVRDDIRDPGAKKQIEGYLSQITGHKYDKWEDYLKWHRRWERIVYIGSKQKKDRIPDLLKYYENTKKSYALKKTIIWAILQCKAREAIPLFLADMQGNDPKMREEAYRAFRSFFVEYPPRFESNASQNLRDQQIAAIREWYKEQEKKHEESKAVSTGG
jgi:hypothetical protein